MQFLSSLFAWANVPFTVSLCVAMIFALLQVTGVLGLLAGGGEAHAEADADVDADVDADADADADHDADSDQDHDADDPGGKGFLEGLGVGKVPISIVWQTFAATFGSAAIAMNTVLLSRTGSVPAYALAWAVPVAWCSATRPARSAARSGACFDPKQEATSRAEPWARGTVISTGDERFGELGCTTSRISGSTSSAAPGRRSRSSPRGSRWCSSSTTARATGSTWRRWTQTTTRGHREREAPRRPARRRGRRSQTYVERGAFGRVWRDRTRVGFAARAAHDGARPMMEKLFNEPQFMLVATGVGVILFFLVTFSVMMAKFYRRCGADEALVRTGAGGTQVRLGGGILVIPVLHQLMRVSLRSLKLSVERSARNALVTRDKIKANVTTELYVKVEPVKEDVLAAARSFGERNLDEHAIGELIEGKLTDALRSVAANQTFMDLHSERKEFAQHIQGALAEELKKNGLTLENVSITALAMVPVKDLDAQTCSTPRPERNQRERADQKTRRPSHPR